MKALKTVEIKVANKSLCNRISVVQDDSGRSLDFVIADMVIPSGATARFYAIKPDGTKVYNNCIVNKNIVTVNLTNQVLATEGNVICQIRVISGNDIVTSFKFTLEVEDSIISDSAVQSSNQFGVLEEALKSVNNIDSNFKKINENIENMYSGGANILRNTNQPTIISPTASWDKGGWRPISDLNVQEWADISDSVNPDIKYGFHILDKATNAQGGIIQYPLLLSTEMEYTASAWFKNIGGEPTTIFMQYGASALGYISKTWTLGAEGEWKRYSWTFKPQATGGGIFFGIVSAAIGEINICGMKLEVGNKSTDWSPSPWDMVMQNSLQWNIEQPAISNPKVSSADTSRVYTNGFLKIWFGRIVLAAGTYDVNTVLCNIGASKATTFAGRFPCQTSSGSNLQIGYYAQSGDIKVSAAITTSAATSVNVMLVAPI